MKIADLLKNPKVQKYLIAAGAFAAGAHGGPLASRGVRAYGPAALDVLARVLGG